MTDAEDTATPEREPGAPAGRRRRVLIVAAVAVGAVALVRGGSWVLDRAAGDLGFIPVDDPPGFRRLSLIGSTSAAFDPFAGVAVPGKVAVRNDAIPEEEFCSALFGQTSFQPGVVPVAFFSDYNCPNCEVLSEDPIAIEAEADGELHLRRHEWPILGASSETSARAAIAAGRQGAQRAFNRRLQRTSFAPSEAYLRDMAQSAGIDPDRLFADMASDATTRELRTSAALVRRFAFPGTPALLVGRTLVVGTIRTATLRALIATERSAGPPPGCW